MKQVLLLLISLSTFFCEAQNSKTLYLEYNERMEIKNIDDKVELSFNLPANDNEPCIYNFAVDNLMTTENGIEALKFEDIKNELVDVDHSIKVHDLKELSKYDFCELQLLFADTERLILIKNIKGKFYQYSLMFLSSMRGWAKVNTH